VKPVTILLALFIAAPIGSLVAAKPIVRAEIDPVSVTVGKAAKLKITVLVPTWFTSPSVYPSLEKLNLITRLPPDSTYPITERINGESWSGILREYELYPQSVNEFTFRSETIRVSFADPDTRKPINMDMPIPGVSLSATIPRGAESLNPFLASSELTLDLVIEGSTDSLKPGDAIIVTATATILDMPAMFLPRLINIPPTRGLALYPNQPTVEETRRAKETRTTSTRSESVTIVFEEPGSYLVPEITLHWWDVKTNSIQTVDVPQHKLTVQGPPISSPNDTGSIFPTGLLVILVIVLMLIVLLFINRERVLNLLAERRARKLVTEHYAFKSLTTAMRHGQKQPVYHEYLHWLGQIQVTVQNITSKIGQRDTAYSFEDLGKELYDDSPGSQRAMTPLTAMQKRSLRTYVDEIRHIARNQSTLWDAANVLPPLNP